MKPESFDKHLEKFVEECKTDIVCISLRNQELYLNGEKMIVDSLSSNFKDMTVSELFKELQNQNTSKTYKYTSAHPVSFPLLSVKFKSAQWNTIIARKELAAVMKVLGFKKGGNKTYKFATHQPEGWPEAVPFVGFKKPKSAKLLECNLILESLMLFHGIDPYTHHQPEASSPSTEPSQSTSTSTPSTPPGPPSDRTEDQDPSFPIENVNLQEEDEEESEDDIEDGELETDLSEPDSSSDNIGKEDTGNDDEDETSDIGRQYLAIRERNMEDLRQLQKELFPDQGTSDIPKPRKKKQKTHPQPMKVTSYGLRKDPRKNQKYTE